MEKNGVNVFNLKNSDELNRAIILANDHRTEFFKYPRGAMAWRNSTTEEKLVLDLKNVEMAESFHFEFCLKCKKNNFKLDKPLYKLNLKKDNLAYYFLCDGCKN